MDDNKFLIDRLCFWVGCSCLIREGLLHKSDSLKSEFKKCKEYFRNSKTIDLSNRTQGSRLKRLLDLVIG